MGLGDEGKGKEEQERTFHCDGTEVKEQRKNGEDRGIGGPPRCEQRTDFADAETYFAALALRKPLWSSQWVKGSNQ